MAFENSAGIDVFNHYGQRFSEKGKTGTRHSQNGSRELTAYITPEVVSASGNFIQPIVLKGPCVIDQVLLKLTEAFSVTDVPAVTAVPQVSTITYDAVTPTAGDIYTVVVNGEPYSLAYAEATHTNFAGFLTALAALVDADEAVSAAYATNVITITGPASGAAFTFSSDEATAAGEAIAAQTPVLATTTAAVLGVSALDAYIHFGDGTNGVTLTEAMLEASPAVYDLTSTACAGTFASGVPASVNMVFSKRGTVADATIGKAELVIKYTVL